jgi:hypothetical protein
MAARVAGWQSALARTAVGAIAIVVVSSSSAAKYFFMASPKEKASPKARPLQTCFSFYFSNPLIALIVPRYKSAFIASSVASSCRLLSRSLNAVASALWARS